MAWMNSCEVGWHCLVEPCARIFPSSVVYHGSTGRLHCVFLICFCWLGWCKHDFSHMAYAIIDAFRFALVFEGYQSVVIDVDYNDVVFYGMDEYFWNGVSLSGRNGAHGTVLARLCITVQRGDFIAFSWFVFIVCDGASMFFFLLWLIWIRPVEISRLRLFLVIRGRGGDVRSIWTLEAPRQQLDGFWWTENGKKKRLEKACSWSFSGLTHCESFRVFHQISGRSRCYSRPSRGVTHSNQVGWTGQYHFISPHVLRETWNHI